MVALMSLATLYLTTSPIVPSDTSTPLSRISLLKRVTSSLDEILYSLLKNAIELSSIPVRGLPYTLLLDVSINVPSCIYDRNPGPGPNLPAISLKTTLALASSPWSMYFWYSPCAFCKSPSTSVSPLNLILSLSNCCALFMNACNDSALFASTCT